MTSSAGALIAQSRASLRRQKSSGGGNGGTRSRYLDDFFNSREQARSGVWRP